MTGNAGGTAGMVTLLILSVRVISNIGNTAFPKLGVPEFGSVYRSRYREPKLATTIRKGFILTIDDSSNPSPVCGVIFRSQAYRLLAVLFFRHQNLK
jgi:hypothetical protein